MALFVRPVTADDVLAMADLYVEAQENQYDITQGPPTDKPGLNMRPSDLHRTHIAELGLRFENGQIMGWKAVNEKGDLRGYIVTAPTPGYIDGEQAQREPRQNIYLSIEEVQSEPGYDYISVGLMHYAVLQSFIKNYEGMEAEVAEGKEKLFQSVGFERRRDNLWELKNEPYVKAKHNAQEYDFDQ